jgi:hypothetical protein
MCRAIQNSDKYYKVGNVRIRVYGGIRATSHHGFFSNVHNVNPKGGKPFFCWSQFEHILQDTIDAAGALLHLFEELTPYSVSRFRFS